MARPLPFTADELVARQLFGVPLTVKDEFGKSYTYPTVAIEDNIRAAVNELERRLQVDLWLRRVVTRPAVMLGPGAVRGVDYDIDDDPMDYDSTAYYAMGYFRLRRYPIQQVNTLQLRFPENTAIFTYPADWLRINRRAGQVSIMATTGTSNPAIVLREGGYLPLFTTGGFLKADVPQLFYVNYTSGIEWDDPLNREEYEDVYRALRQLAASYTLLDLGRGRKLGITSESLSEDGQSESTSYARSKGSLYQGELDALNAEVDKFVKSWKQYRKGPVFQIL